MPRPYFVTKHAIKRYKTRITGLKHSSTKKCRAEIIKAIKKSSKTRPDRRPDSYWCDLGAMEVLIRSEFGANVVITVVSKDEQGRL